ncbi:MAG: HAMP domain-containing sensor histidine kinase [Candidatus Hydrogenedentota bacterium]
MIPHTLSFDRTCGAIVRGFLHDVANPLAAAMMNLDCMRDNENDADRDEIIRDAKLALKETQAILGRVRDICLYETGDVAAGGTLGKIDAILENIAADFEARTGRENRTLKFRIASACRSDAPEKLVRNIVANLVEELLRHEAASVTLSSRAQDLSIQLIVEADGHAPPPDIPLFSPHCYLSKNCSWNRGLLLTHVHRAVTFHGGSVSCSVSDQGGARFEILLPARETNRASD